MLWQRSGVKAMHIGYYEMLDLCQWHNNLNVDDVIEQHPDVNFDSFTEDEFKNFLIKHY
jgi:hypothetical protein